MIIFQLRVEKCSEIKLARSVRHYAYQILFIIRYYMENVTKDQSSQIDSIIINEVQLLLAEKRTSLSVLRTGIAVMALPMSVISVLIATSKYYNVFYVLHYLIPLGILNLGLVVLGIYLIVHSISRMRKYDRHINQIKIKYSSIEEFVG